MSIDKPATQKQNNVLARAGYSDTELKGLSVGQASTLLDYLSRNKWKRPNVGQQEAIVGGQLLEEEKATETAFVMAYIPTSTELDEVTRSMSFEQKYEIDDAIDDLKQAVEKGERALIQHAYALAKLRATCKHGEWRKLLEVLRVPPATAHRQIQLAKAYGCLDERLRRILEFKGIKFRSTMTAKEVEIVQKAAELAKQAEKEAQMSHRETNEYEEWPGLGPGSQLRDQQIEATVQETVGAFIDSQLPKKPPQALIANPTHHLWLQPAEAQGTKSIAWDIGGLVVGRLNALVPADKRGEVWSLIVEYVEGEGGDARE